jgi:hypothetical protein
VLLITLVSGFWLWMAPRISGRRRDDDAGPGTTPTSIPS